MVNPKAKKEGAKRMGRPRQITPNTYTQEMLERIDACALAQCKDTTIAEALGFEAETFKRDMSLRTRQKRAEGKTKILRAQYAGCLADTPTAYRERIWWGKQYLDQTDRSRVDSNATFTLNDAAIALGIAKTTESAG